jgi:hypothetical protein
MLDFVVGNPYFKVVTYMGELFYLTSEGGGDILSLGGFHFGPKNETNNFRYGIKIGNSDVPVCLKSKCTDFPMDELAKWHLVYVYQRVGSDLG